jgi:DNA mismatch repair ATPase MutS
VKAYLMFRDRDFDLQGGLPANEAVLRQDLELNTLLDTMAAGDKFLLEVAKKTLLTSLGDPEAICYRQNILTDCLEQSSIIREMYFVAVEAIEREKKVWGSSYRQSPESLLHRSLEVLEIFVAQIKLLRRIADAHYEKFRSEGLTRLFDMLTKELNDDYLSVVENHFRQLKFRNGLLISAQLGEGNKGTQYLLRKYFGRQLSWMERLLVWAKGLLSRDHSDFTYQIPDRDESGFRALSALRDRGVALVAGALGQSTDHILSFFGMLRLELGFYIACLNLYERLAGKGESVCIPEPLAMGKAMLSGRGVYDVSLSLSLETKAVGNDLIADGKLLVMITGANRGGKSTFLRGLGQAQLMMQCGMFVAGEFFRANVCDGIFTHFKREEDTAMRSGKFDE